MRSFYILIPTLALLNLGVAAQPQRPGGEKIRSGVVQRAIAITERRQFHSADFSSGSPPDGPFEPLRHHSSRASASGGDVNRGLLKRDGGLVMCIFQHLFGQPPTAGSTSTYNVPLLGAVSNLLGCNGSPSAGPDFDISNGATRLLISTPTDQLNTASSDSVPNNGGDQTVPPVGSGNDLTTPSPIPGSNFDSDSSSGTDSNVVNVSNNSVDVDGLGALFDDVLAGDGSSGDLVDGGALGGGGINVGTLNGMFEDVLGDGSSDGDPDLLGDVINGNTLTGVVEGVLGGVLGDDSSGNPGSLLGDDINVGTLGRVLEDVLGDGNSDGNRDSILADVLGDVLGDGSDGGLINDVGDALGGGVNLDALGGVFGGDLGDNRSDGNADGLAGGVLSGAAEGALGSGTDSNSDGLLNGVVEDVLGGGVNSNALPEGVSGGGDGNSGGVVTGLVAQGGRGNRGLVDSLLGGDDSDGNTASRSSSGSSSSSRNSGTSAQIDGSNSVVGLPYANYQSYNNEANQSSG